MAKVIPIFRVFDYHKVQEFYVNWLGFKIDWEHRPDNAPFFLSASWQDVTLYLSEHHGDASPGGKVIIECEGLRAYHKGLLDQEYKYNRPGIGPSDHDPDTLEVTVIDPFYNQIIFSEKTK
ncbi:glyoxalase superfamily protein [Chitinophaga vietnamensis]|uniref:glyoxalase superfamily protein n=1 Tax=Chitinophaga vietnamensis TaxID=2593957 RepID=UPI0011778BAE|nr:glyoxalase superfamily protein [Chitinophaga vietnamensis]